MQSTIYGTLDTLLCALYGIALNHGRLDSSPVLVREVPKNTHRQNLAIVVTKIGQAKVGGCQPCKSYVTGRPGTYRTGALEREHPDHRVMLPSVVCAYRCFYESSLRRRRTQKRALTVFTLWYTKGVDCWALVTLYYFVVTNDSEFWISLKITSYVTWMSIIARITSLKERS